MRTMLTDEQHVWECRWARLRSARTPLPRKNVRLAIAWVCARQVGERRPVEDKECADCAHWEPDPLVL